MITETVSRTNKPPTIAKTISCLTIIAIAASEPPNEREPVSPIKIFAGVRCTKENLNKILLLNHKIDNSPTSGIYCICKYSEKIVLPTTYEIRVNESATNITGTVANPSKPSVKFTALEAPIITNSPKGIKNKPMCHIKFLKMENTNFQDIRD